MRSAADVLESCEPSALASEDRAVRADRVPDVVAALGEGARAVRAVLGGRGVVAPRMG